MGVCPRFMKTLQTLLFVMDVNGLQKTYFSEHEAESL